MRPVQSHSDGRERVHLRPREASGEAEREEKSGGLHMRVPQVLFLLRGPVGLWACLPGDWPSGLAHRSSEAPGSGATWFLFVQPCVH